MYWKITGQINTASDRNVNCVNWGTSANQYYFRSSCPPHFKLKLSLDVKIHCVWVCLQFPQLAGNCGVLFFVLFSMQMWCNILIFFGSKLDWKLYCVIIFMFLMLFGTQVVNIVYCCLFQFLLPQVSYRFFFYQSSLSQWNYICCVTMIPKTSRAQGLTSSSTLLCKQMLQKKKKKSLG